MKTFLATWTELRDFSIAPRMSATFRKGEERSLMRNFKTSCMAISILNFAYFLGEHGVRSMGGLGE